MILRIESLNRTWALKIADSVFLSLVLSQADLVDGHSREPGISKEGIKEREAAFEEYERGWHSVSLVSARDNHTEEEVEL